MKRLIVIAICLFLSLPALAADKTGAPAPKAPERTRIVVDQKTNTIRFIIDGTEQARIDTTGLHVRNDVEYGGSITDTGPAAYDANDKRRARAQ